MVALEQQPTPPHVVLVALPTQGHMSPLTSLANYLAASGISVTIIHSARAHTLLSQAHHHQSSSTSSSSQPQYNNTTRLPIRVEVVPDGMPTDPKQRLPVGALRTFINVIGRGVEELLQEKLMQEEQPPVCLIMDMGLASWGAHMAVKFGLPWMMVWTSSASIFSVSFHVPELVARGYIPAMEERLKDEMIDFISGLPPFRVRDLPTSFNVEDPHNHPMLQLLHTIFDSAKHTDRILINSIYEIESSVVQSLREKEGFRIDMVGPLFMMNCLSSTSSSCSPTTGASLLPEDTSCLSWLDQQEESSVLYVSFGSVVHIEEDVLAELAHGVEASGVNFLWVIRPDALSEKESMQEIVPDGFMERTYDRGRVISWAPQLAVLGHPSVGAFLTHCGWNSVLESLSHGVPILGFPRQAEQNTNLAFVVQEWKVGLPLVEQQPQRDVDPQVPAVERSQVQRAVTAIMRGGEGAQVRKRALEWKQIAMEACRINGSSKSTLEKLVDDLKSGHCK